MTVPVQTVAHDALGESAAELMTTYAVTALPVLGADGQLIGMVSESDLLWHRVPAEPHGDPRRHPDTEPPVRRPGVVVEVMSEFPITTTPRADVADVAQSMLDHDVRSLPVLDHGRLVGIVSRRDILKAMVRDDRSLTADVQLRLDDYAGRPGLWTAEVTCGIATVYGRIPNEQQRAVVMVLARTVPGVAAVHLAPETDSEPETESRQDRVTA